mgnify:CR=1 FL=1
MTILKNYKNEKKFYIYGIHSVKEALKNQKRKKIFLHVSTNAYEKLIEEIKNCDVKFEVVNVQKLNYILKKDITHQGAILETLPIKNDIEFEKICHPDTKDTVILMLDQLYDPQNVGAILRTAEFFGAKAVITTKNHSSKETSALAKSASGALEHQPFLKVINLKNTMKILKKMGYFIIGLDSNSDLILEETLKIIGKEPLVLVLGSEGKGLRDLTKKNCDFLSKIPFKNNMCSLNVSSAAAISLYLARNKSI